MNLIRLNYTCMYKISSTHHLHIMMIAGSCHCYELLEQVPVMLSDVANCNICIATLASTFGCFVHSVYEPPYYYNVS